jgi:hypothetical protein
MLPQEHDALEGAARATSPEIQETGEGSGAAQLPNAENGDAWILDLAVDTFYLWFLSLTFTGKGTKM